MTNRQPVAEIALTDTEADRFRRLRVVVAAATTVQAAECSLIATLHNLAAITDGERDGRLAASQAAFDATIAHAAHKV